MKRSQSLGKSLDDVKYEQYVNNLHDRLPQLTDPNDIDCQRWPWELLQNAKDTVVKRKNPAIKEGLDSQELEFMKTTPLFEEYSLALKDELVKKIVDCADAIDVLYYINREKMLGNRTDIVTEGDFEGIQGRVSRIAGQQRVIVELFCGCLVASAYIPKEAMRKVIDI